MGGFDPTFEGPAGEDRDLCERWVAAGGAVRPCPDAVVGHAHHLTAGSFLRQQYRYGRAAPAVHRRRQRSGGGLLRASVYVDVLRPAVHSSTRVSGALLLSQPATAVG